MSADIHQFPSGRSAIEESRGAGAAAAAPAASRFLEPAEVGAAVPTSADLLRLVRVGVNKFSAEADEQIAAARLMLTGAAWLVATLGHSTDVEDIVRRTLEAHGDSRPPEAA